MIADAIQSKPSLGKDRVIIYALSDPRKPSMIRYIGKTCKSLRSRLAQHILSRRRYKTHKTAWIDLLLRLNLKPRIWPLEICSSTTWEDRERYWIALFKHLPKFLNILPSGDATYNSTGSRHTEEWKQKMSARMTGKKYSKERIAKARGALMTSPKFKAAYEAKIGTKRSPEYFRKCKATRATSKKWIDTHYKPVLCVTTGVRFSSITQAANSVSSNICNLSRALRRNWKFHGMEWRYA